MVEVGKIGDKTLVLDGRYISIFKARELLWKKAYMGYLLPDGNLYMFRRRVRITELSGNTLTDYQIKIEIGAGDPIFAHARSAGEDIRFCYYPEEEMLSYWIEKFDPVAEEAIIWVKVPSIPANSEIEIYMYYGNPEVASASDGEATFVYFNYDGKINFDQYPYGSTSNVGTDPSAWLSEEGYIKGIMTQDKTHMAAIKDITLDNLHAHFKWNHGVLEEIEEVGFNFRWSSQANRYFIRHIYYPGANRVRYELMKMVDGTSTILKTYNFSPTADTWYAVDIYLYGSTVKIYHEGSLIIEDTTLTDFSSGYFGLHQAHDLNTVHYFDDIYVAKYTEPEPSVSVGAEE